MRGGERRNNNFLLFVVVAAEPHSVTVIRHPVERLISEYYYIQSSLPLHPARVSFAYPHILISLNKKQ